jgi:hypothetical protein
MNIKEATDQVYNEGFQAGRSKRDPKNPYDKETYPHFHEVWNNGFGDGRATR